jgi:hypothetical protein
VRVSWAVETINCGLGEAWKARYVGGSWRKSFVVDFEAAGRIAQKAEVERKRKTIVLRDLESN